MNVLVVGGSGGIGGAMTEAFCAREDVGAVVATCRSHSPTFSHPKLRWERLDVTVEASVARLFETLPPLDYLVNAVGVLHSAAGGPEKTISRFEPEFFLRSMQLNAMPTLLLARHAQALFKGRPRAVFAAISARVGSIGDNQLGGWFSYRCSKAALNMALKTLSIEWRRTLPNVVVAALHPGTTDTALSAPFQANVPPASLFDPARSAANLLGVIDGLEPARSGRFWSWDGSELPW
jgi:NAD(P)-dependent dehydrogenase (short-subunit alcohol dehydrogenase family)